MSTVVFDIGGTKTRVSISRDGKTIRRFLVYETPKHYAEGIRQLVDAIRTMADGWKISRIVGCIAAPLDAKHERTAHPANLPDWYRSPLVADLHRRFHVRVRLENDAALAGLGEAIFGAGKDANIVAYIGFGTGIGGVRIVNKKIDGNVFGFEPGHQIIDWTAQTSRKPHTHAGDWESLISGGTIFSTTGKYGEHISSARFWRQAEERAAVGLVNVALFWSPDVIILGGSLVKKMSLTSIEKIYRQRMKVIRKPPFLKKAALGDYAGLYGALALARK